MGTPNKELVRISTNTYFSVKFVGLDKICTAGLDGLAQIHDLESTTRVADLKGHEAGLNHCAVRFENFPIFIF